MEVSRPAWEASIYPAKQFLGSLNLSWKAFLGSLNLFCKSETPKAPEDGVWVPGFVQSLDISVKFGMKFYLERRFGSASRLPLAFFLSAMLKPGFLRQVF